MEVDPTVEEGDWRKLACKFYFRSRKIRLDFDETEFRFRKTMKNELRVKFTASSATGDRGRHGSRRGGPAQNLATWVLVLERGQSILVLERKGHKKK